MTSSMMTGERRWASARRGGMTVLGKVAVPKPLNLPSQRGTLSWGSRSSSSASNAWGSSTLSPNTDGGTGSPSHLSGRPSSGGSGTRPSTAGSDRTHEPTASAWGPNSRPSSASGALASNQSPVTSLRPRSAETRPGSSQLSRFAEPLSENSVAWGASGTVEKLGVTSSKNDGFSLTSGDFPTLGSEKDNSAKKMESKDHGPHSRPGSSSGGVPLVKERTATSPAGSRDVSVTVNAKGGPVNNSWKRDNSPYVEDGVQPGVEKWQSDAQPYQNTNRPPHHFDPWHGAPVGNPPGVWYRGPPGGPYGAPIAPGVFPMEPYPFYRPQIPAPALTNSQPIPPPGAGPRGHHPKNGDMYRPHMPDAYIRPGMPMRPGFYPGPVAYEGYYVPPMGYCNSSERDIPFMGMAAGPSAYNKYASQNAPDSSNSQTRSGGYGSTAKTSVPEQVESGNPHDPRGQYKVLLKQQNDWDGNEEDQKQKLAVPANAPYFGKVDQQRTSAWENDWRADRKKVEPLDSRRTTVGEEASSQTLENQGSAPEKVKIPGNLDNVNAVDDTSVKKLENVGSAFPEVSTTSTDSTLMQKIEGLNAKARASDGRHDVASTSSREEQKNKLQVAKSKANHSTDDANSGAVYHERTYTSGIFMSSSHEAGLLNGDKNLESVFTGGNAIPRRAAHGVQGRVDHHSRGRFNPQEADGWLKKSRVADSSSLILARGSDASNVNSQDHCTTVDADNRGSYLEGKDGGESVVSTFESSDVQAQRGKMRERAKQRAKQLQEEEEERMREQTAKAHAKLEELNRRKQPVEGLTKKENVLADSAIHCKQEDTPSFSESTSNIGKDVAPNSAIVPNANVAQNSESSTCRVDESPILSSEPPLKTLKDAYYQESAVIHSQSLPLEQDGHNADDAKATRQYHDGVSRKKRVGYKQKNNIPSEKSLTEKSTISTTEVPKSHTDEVVNATASAEVVANEIASSFESSVPVNPIVTAEPSVHPRRKYRPGKNKHKLEETLPVVGLPSPVPKETNLPTDFIESEKPKASGVEMNPCSDQPPSSSTDAVQSSECLPQPSEESHGVNNQWKSQNPRKLQKNQQINRSSEKFHGGDTAIWAPVRSQNRIEVNEEASHKTVLEEAVTPTRKSDHPLQNNLKNKRAELERYVPKPVAKELAQQGSVQQPSSPTINQTTSNESTRRTKSGSQSTESTQPASLAVGKVGSSVESRSGDTKHNKQAKTHGSWRQRGSTDSTRMQGLQDGSSSTSKPSKDVQESGEHGQPLKPDVQLVKGQPKSSDEWSTADGWNTPINSDSAAPVTYPVVKDQGITGRGKRHPYKGHKGTGSNNHDLDHKNVDSGDTDKIYGQSSALELSETDRSIASKENRGFGDRSTSHWQPKSQSQAQNQRGSRSGGGQNAAADVGKFVKKESTPQVGLHVQPNNDKGTGEDVIPSRSDQSMPQRGSLAHSPSAEHQEVKRERKVASTKVRPHSPNDGSVSLVEAADHAGVDSQHEQQRFSSGFRKNGNQNRFGRGHDSRGDWSSAGQDNKQHNVPANRERQRHNSHYEYQPVGPYNNNKSNNFEGSADVSHNSRFRERGQSHSRRGGANFYGRPSGTVRVEAGYD